MHFLYEVRSFIYIDDFLEAFNLILEKGKHLNIYNIGNSERIKIKNLAYKMAKLYNKKILIKNVSLRKGSARYRVPDIKKIKKLGFKSRFNLDRGLKKILFL